MFIPISETTLDGNEQNYLMETLTSTWISSAGEFVSRFEKSFSGYCGVNHGVATANGTVALHLALVALDVGPGDEVIVPNLTFAATINAVIYTGATPVIVDIEQDSWCISPEEIEKVITSRTKAIIPVHLFGQPCDMGKICNIAQKHNLKIVEDCAQAHGAEFNGAKVGSFGDINCFSFYGNKIISTGEGGMCLTNDTHLNDKMRVLKDHGMNKSKRYFHDVIGFNYRMTNMQSAIGAAQMERIDEMLQWRRELEQAYKKRFSQIKDLELQRDDLHNRKKVAWLISVLVPAEKRRTCIQKLEKAGFDTRTFFYPLSSMEIYKKYVFSENVSNMIAEQGINLPTIKRLTGENIADMAEIFQECL